MIPEPVKRTAPEIADFLIQQYRTDRGVHAETLLGAVAALAGEFALRAAEPELPQDGWVLSDNVNGILFEDEGSGEITMWSIIRIGASRDDPGGEGLPDPVEVVARVGSAVGGSPFPPLSVPAEHYPHEWSPNACPRYRADIEKIGERNGLGKKDLALALALAITLLIANTREVLDPAIAATLALEIMIGVSRMAPLEEPIT